MTLGADYKDEDNADIRVGEFGTYPMDKSGKIADIEAYLSDKWGIAI